MTARNERAAQQWPMEPCLGRSVNPSQDDVRPCRVTETMHRDGHQASRGPRAIAGGAAAQQSGDARVTRGRDGAKGPPQAGAAQEPLGSGRGSGRASPSRLCMAARDHVRAAPGLHLALWLLDPHGEEGASTGWVEFAQGPSPVSRVADGIPRV